jgi:hypothetical protein
MEMNSASITRVHDAMLGGQDNFAVDRAVRDRLLALDPDFPAAAQDVRDFQIRSVRYVTREAGVTQLLDCGLRLPITDNSDAFAPPGTPVVYPTVDPYLLAKGQAQLRGNAHVTEVNISRAERVLTDPVVRKHLDFTRPIGLMHVLTLHHFPDHDDPWLTMQQYVDALPSGSYVVIAHFLDPGPDDELSATITKVADVYRANLGTGWPRRKERILDLLPGLVVVGPGLVPVGDWRPDKPRVGPLGAMQRLVMGAVALKP